MRNKNRDNKIDNVLAKRDLQKLKYFFSLALEDYFGDKEELMKMAGIDEKLLQKFLHDLPVLTEN